MKEGCCFGDLSLLERCLSTMFRMHFFSAMSHILIKQMHKSTCRFPRRFEITNKHLITTICLIWTIAVGGSASSMSSAGVIGMIRPVAGRMCLTRLCIQVNPTNEKEQFQLAFRCSMYLIFALFLFLLYTNIGLFIYRSKSPGLEITAEASAARKRQAVRMLVAATVVMILSYLPYMVLVSRILFAQPGYFSPVFAVEILCNVISGLNHVVNPFIYCALSLQFREGFKKFFAYLQRKSHSIAPETQVRQQRNMAAAVALNERRDSMLPMSTMVTSNIAIELEMLKLLCTKNKV